MITPTIKQLKNVVYNVESFCNEYKESNCINETLLEQCIKDLQEIGDHRLFESNPINEYYSQITDLEETKEVCKRIAEYYSDTFTKIWERGERLSILKNLIWHSAIQCEEERQRLLKVKNAYDKDEQQLDPIKTIHEQQIDPNKTILLYAFGENQKMYNEFWHINKHDRDALLNFFKYHKNDFTLSVWKDYALNDNETLKKLSTIKGYKKMFLSWLVEKYGCTKYLIDNDYPSRQFNADPK